MGSYEREMQLIAEGKAERGATALAYFAEIDAAANQLTVSPRPDYTDTLFAPRNDDIYRELCRFIDQEPPRHFDTVPDPIAINGYTAADVYTTMLKNNWKLRDLDAGAVYDMLVTLREEPVIAERILRFRPTCDKSGAC